LSLENRYFIFWSLEKRSVIFWCLQKKISYLAYSVLWSEDSIFWSLERRSVIFWSLERKSANLEGKMGNTEAEQYEFVDK
jgi:hypothetical protein